MTKKNYTIIGASAAGIAAAKKIRLLDPEANIVCFSAESEMPYNKCFLVDFISKERDYESLFLQTKNFFDEQKISLHLNTPILSIDRSSQVIVTRDGLQYKYDKLLLATGAGPRLLSTDLYKGKNHEKIVPFYTLHNTERIKAVIEQKNVTKIVILGGGISGLECADALAGNSNKQITVIERASYIGSAHLLERHAAFIADCAKLQNVECVTNVTIEKIIDKDLGFEIHCSNGCMIQADCIITAMGAVVNTDLAQESGIDLELGAIATNAFLQTNDEDVSAAGDCATVNESIHGFRMRSCMWSDALVQGTIAGTNMVGLTRKYQGALPITVSSLFGLQVVSYQKHLLDTEMYRTEHTKDGNTFYSVAYDSDNVVKAFVGVGLQVSYTLLKRSLITCTPYAV